MFPAQFYAPLANLSVRCELCPRGCVIPDGATGDCLARKNYRGQLGAETYGKVCSLALDPVEKKPLYHFYPGEMILSVGSFGCNLHCAFCQNWEISQQIAPAEEITPDKLIALARAKNARLIAYTYNEPLINFEFVFACCQAARDAGLKNVLVSNGYINAAPREKLLPLVDALNLDLKAFAADFYARHCAGKLAPVLDTIKFAAAHCHVEITTLLIASLNDAPEILRAQATWIAENCGENTPLHLSAYFPRYRFSLPETSPATLAAAREIFREQLNFVYLGNIAAPQNTYCPQCKNLLMARRGYQTQLAGLQADACARCGEKIKIILS